MKINLTVPVCHLGHHYTGITVNNGVTMELVDNCAGGKAVRFGNCAQGTPENLPTPNTGTVSAAKIEEESCPMYLQLTPAE